MDDTTQNAQQTPQSQADGSMAQTAPGAVNPTPVDPMANVQVPDLPTMPGGDPVAPAQPAVDPAQADASQAMQQMATTSPTMATPAPMDPMPNVPMAQPADPIQAAVPQPQADGPLAQAAPSLGPVTMEDLMEELQHIEDKLDEMDEKL